MKKKLKPNKNDKHLIQKNKDFRVNKKIYYHIFYQKFLQKN